MNKEKIALIVAMIIIVVLALALILRGNSGAPYGTTSGGGANGPSAPLRPVTRTDVPPGVTVPGLKDANVAPDTAKPYTVAPAGPGTQSKLRGYNIQISGRQFIPDNIVVNVGDTAHINLTAVDMGYDFYQPDYGLSTTIAKGQQKLVEFSAITTGKFTFYCKSCGGPAKGPIGYIIVVPK